MATTLSVLRRLCGFKLIALGALAALWTVSTQEASASTGSLASIVCGGQKVNDSTFGSSSTWQTYLSGGYVGKGCGPGIDVVSAPTLSESIYDFGAARDSGLHTFKAFVPAVSWVNATVQFSLVAWCSRVSAPLYIKGKIVNESYYHGQFVTLFSVSGLPQGCDIALDTWTSDGNPNHVMGLDAVTNA